MKAFQAFAVLLLVAASANVAATPTAVDAALARAGEFEEQQKFAEELAVLQPFAESGNAKVEFSLAFAHMEHAVGGHKPGEIPPDEIQLAITFAQRAIDHGNPSAYHLLGLIYSNGWGVPADLARGMGYLEKGNELGDKGSRLNLAIAYYWGNEALPRDFSKACDLFRQNLADNPQDVLSVYYMGRSIFLGHCDRPADKSAGIDLIKMAAEHGVRDAMRDMGKSLEFGWVGERDLAQALQWYQKAADHGEPNSQWRVGMAYVNGELGPKDSVKAVQFLERSAASEDPDGLTDLGVMYATGDGVTKDFDKARSLYERAAALGVAHAYRELATMYVHGEGVAVDPVRARVLYLQSVELGEEDVAAFRSAVESKLTAEQMKESDQRLEQWRRTRAGQ